MHKGRARFWRAFANLRSTHIYPRLDHRQIYNINALGYGKLLNALPPIDKVDLKILHQTMGNSHAAHQMTNAKNMSTIKQ